MGDTAIPAPQGVRLPWSQVPDDVRAAIADRLGSPVVTAENQRGGFSPGLAARCRLADGRRCFIKAVSPEPNPGTPWLHRQEATVAAALPRDLPVPRLLEVLDDGTWIVLVFEEVDGVPPATPWTLDGLAAALATLADLAERTTPCPVEGLPSFVELHGPSLDGFRRLAGGGRGLPVDPWVARHLDTLAELEGRWAPVASGTTLVHADVRADNLLVRPDGSVVVVDWPGACTGAPWLDVVLLLPSAGLDGGPPPSEVEEALDPFAGVDAEAVDLVLVGLAGYFTWQGGQPDPPGLPTLRAFQRAQGRVARQWLATRRRLA
jgi:hypothetical protein